MTTIKILDWKFPRGTNRVETISPRCNTLATDTDRCWFRSKCTESTLRSKMELKSDPRVSIDSERWQKTWGTDVFMSLMLMLSTWDWHILNHCFGGVLQYQPVRSESIVDMPLGFFRNTTTSTIVDVAAPCTVPFSQQTQLLLPTTRVLSKGALQLFC